MSTFPAELVVPVASTATVIIIIRCGADTFLSLVAGITAIVAKDTSKSRAARALAVLKALRGTEQPPEHDDDA